MVGELVGSGLRLTPHAVVTTTWGEWRRRHPETTVLSLDTGHRRNYAEGAAYRTYFGSDDLMFAVSRRDARLPNKEEVLVLRLPDPERPGGRLPLAVTARFLSRNRVYHRDFAGRNLVVVTSGQGANRVYDAGDGSLRAPYRRRAGGRRRRTSLAGLRGRARAGRTTPACGVWRASRPSAPSGSAGTHSSPTPS